MAEHKLLGIEQARTQLPSLITQAHQGAVSVVTRHGKPYAAIVPMDILLAQRRRVSGFLALRGSGKQLWKQPATAVVSGLREEWD